VTGRIIIAAAVTALSLGCASLRSMTQSQREAASRRVAMKMEGTVVTEGELFQMDMDRTFVCGTEPQVGSHIPRYQCRTLRRVVRERESRPATSSRTTRGPGEATSRERGHPSTGAAPPWPWGRAPPWWPPRAPG
jgi:hypothetical protein